MTNQENQENKIYLLEKENLELKNKLNEIYKIANNSWYLRSSYKRDLGNLVQDIANIINKDNADSIGEKYID